MRRQLRVNSADILEPHDHVVWYGDGPDDLYALASAALPAGARLGEKLMFVAEEPDPTRLRDIGDLVRLVDQGQLEIVKLDDVYGASGEFDAASQLATFEGVLTDALADGYTGIRVVAENTRLASGDDASFHRWLCWEQVTDRFQHDSNVTGICYFDRRALPEARRADLASLHPVCSTSTIEPPFSLFVNEDAVSVTGALDGWSSAQFVRILDTAPDDRPLIVDLAQTEFVDHRALMALNAAASERRPVRVRSARPLIRQLPQLLSIATPHLCFE